MTGYTDEKYMVRPFYYSVIGKDKTNRPQVYKVGMLLSIREQMSEITPKDSDKKETQRRALDVL